MRLSSLLCCFSGLGGKKDTPPLLDHIDHDVVPEIFSYLEPDDFQASYTCKTFFDSSPLREPTSEMSLSRLKAILTKPKNTRAVIKNLEAAHPDAAKQVKEIDLSDQKISSRSADKLVKLLKDKCPDLSSLRMLDTEINYSDRNKFSNKLDIEVFTYGSRENPEEEVSA